MELLSKLFVGEREERLGLHLLSVLEENIFSFFVRLSLLLAGEREGEGYG